MYELTLAFRVDTSSNDFSIIYESVRASVWSDLEQRRESVAGTIESYKSTQEQMRPYVNQGPERAQAAAKQTMEKYAKNIETAEAELKEIDAQLARGPVEPIGPMIDGGDGVFYGAAEDRLFKLKKDTMQYTRLHIFEGAPLDGRWARTPPMITRNGILYGFTAGGGISKGGVIYRINRDGSGYQLAYNPDQRATFIGNPIEAPDGTVYAVLPTGLYHIDSIDTALPPVDLFGAYTRAENLQFVGQDLYGVIQRGNGRGEIFRYVLPSAGSSSGGLVAVHESVLSPGPLGVPSDSPDPEQVLFADIKLPAAVQSSGGQPQEVASANSAQDAQASNETADGKSESKNPDKPPSEMEKAAEQVEETAKKAKKLFKSFGF